MAQPETARARPDQASGVRLGGRSQSAQSRSACTDSVGSPGLLWAGAADSSRARRTAHGKRPIGNAPQASYVFATAKGGS